jgi:hypothetical protein
MAPGHQVIRSQADWRGSVDALETLCRKADTIVVGQVAGIIRTAHMVPGVASSPINTVYEVAVENYLEADGAPQQPPTIRVAQSGGTLGDATQVIEGDPLLNVGSRYILFLTGFKHDMVSVSGGVSGITAFRGEFKVTDRIRGKLLLKDGKTAVASDPYQTPSPWVFGRTRENLLGLNEADAIAKIQQAVAKAPKQLEGGGYPGRVPY